MQARGKANCYKVYFKKSSKVVHVTIIILDGYAQTFVKSDMLNFSIG